MNEIVEYKDMLASHPGEFIQEIIDDMGTTAEEFAAKAGVDCTCLADIIEGRQSVTPELASILAKATGMNAQVWLNLQTIYDERILEIKKRIQQEKAVAEDCRKQHLALANA